MCITIALDNKNLSNNLSPECCFLAASILNSGTTIIKNLPDTHSVKDSIDLLENLGCEVIIEDHCAMIDSTNIHDNTIPVSFIHNHKAFRYFLAALAGRFGEVIIAHAGEYNIGINPFRIFIMHLRELGFEANDYHGKTHFRAINMKTSHFTLHYPGTVITACLMMMAMFLEGVTQITGASRAPEINELKDFLTKIGAIIRIEEPDMIVITK